MKKLSFLFAMTAMLFIGLDAQAQREIVIHEIVEYMSQGEQPGFEIALVDAVPDDVESSVVKFLKKHKAKVTNSRKSVEIFGDNAKFPTISPNTVDVYAIALKADYGTRLLFFFDLGGAFLNASDHDAEFAASQILLREFGLSEAVRVNEEEMKAQEKIMKELKKDLDNLVKDKEGYIADIEKAKALIAEKEKEIAENEAKQDTKRQEIDIQDEIIKLIKTKRAEIPY